jgi:hypothetical protein
MIDYEDLIDRLAAIEGEDLRDRAYDRLRRAASATDEDELRAAKADERCLLQARRAVARAIGALKGMSASED